MTGFRAKLARILYQVWCGLFYNHPASKTFPLYVGEGLYRCTCERCGAIRVVHE